MTNPNARVLIAPHPDRPAQPDWRCKTHATDCRWALGVEASRPTIASYLVVPAWTVPASTGRCSWCGGGR